MSTTPRFPPAEGFDEPNFAALLMHTPQTAQAFFSLYARFWQQGVLSQEIKEMTRIRNARITDCGY